MKSYSILAKYYDKFSQNDCDYVDWSQYLCKVAKQFNVQRIADIACGTGKMTKLLTENGFDVLGIDSSLEMLQQARNKCRATFVCQDMKRLSLTKPADMAVVVNDGLNYLKPQELAPFFCTLARNLKAGAPVVFDISSQYKLQNVLANNVYFVDEDDATLLWTNNTNSAKTQMTLTLFEKQGDFYRRFDETHTQYVHTQQSVQSALEQSGFVLWEVTADYGKQLSPTSLRITFLAQFVGKVEDHNNIG